MQGIVIHLEDTDHVRRYKKSHGHYYIIYDTLNETGVTEYLEDKEEGF